jgi:predicted phosphoribosyltransferase
MNTPAAPPRFENRAAAGEALADALAHYRGANVLVLGLPRGGVPVGAKIAQALAADLDVIVARKLGSPISAELAIGAVTADGERYLNDGLISELGVSDGYLRAVTERELAEARQRETQLRRGRPAPRVAGRIVILVDDGLATGATMRAAVRSVKRQRPARLVVAVPVGSVEACDALRSEADEIVCLRQPEPFGAVGTYYHDFLPTTDSEVRQALGQAPALQGVEPW